MIPVSNHEFDRAVQAALNRIPAQFRPYLENVIIEVMPQPTPDMLEPGEFPEDLLGVYLGIPLEDKALADTPTPMPDRVVIFRDNLFAECDSREDLIDEIRITVLHEIGHHFGLDEDDLANVGYD